MTVGLFQPILGHNHVYLHGLFFVKVHELAETCLLLSLFVQGLLQGANFFHGLQQILPCTLSIVRQGKNVIHGFIQLRRFYHLNGHHLIIRLGFLGFFGLLGLCPLLALVAIHGWLS